MTDDLPIAVALDRFVRPGMERRFEAALRDHLSDAMKARGHLGVDVFPPLEHGAGWTCVFRFDRRSNLESWMRSPVQARWERVAKELSTRSPVVRMVGSKSRVETNDAERPDTAPPRWKLAFVTWIAIYPTITFLLLAAGPSLGRLAVPLRTLFLTGVLVPLMTFVLMPAVTRALTPWLTPRVPDASSR